MTAQIIEDRLGGNQHLVPVMMARVLPLEGDALQNLFLTLRAKPIQLRHLACLACLLQVLNRLDAQLLVDRLDLLRAHALHIEHLDQTGRDGGFQRVVIFQLTRLHQLSDFLNQRFAYALHFAETLLLDERFQRFCKPLQSACTIDVGAGLERILPLELEQDPDFFQYLGNRVLIHERSLMAEFLRFGNAALCATRRGLD